MRILPLLVLSLLGTASSTAEWPGRPRANPPRLHQEGPPPAWIESRTRSTWLAYGSYCWTTVCVDMIPPAMRKDVPLLSVKSGNPVRVHLAFAPKTAHVLLLRGNRSQPMRLAAKRLLVWRPRTAGIAFFDVRGAAGSAGYIVRLRVTAAAG